MIQITWDPSKSLDIGTAHEIFDELSRQDFIPVEVDGYRMQRGYHHFDASLGRLTFSKRPDWHERFDALDEGIGD